LNKQRPQAVEEDVKVSAFAVTMGLLIILGTTASRPVMGQAFEAAIAQETVDFQFFYDQLELYGDWFEIDPYGLVWQPRVAQEDPYWQPYLYGEWIYTDYGWTWVTGENFGWITYHYGRWDLLGEFGWIWVPDEIWAPAWVTWRENEQFVGWAPLPPETLQEDLDDYQNWQGPEGLVVEQYVYVPTAVLPYPVRTHALPRAQCRAIHPNTRKATRYEVRSGRLVVNGPNLDWLQRNLGRPVVRHRLIREFRTRAAARPRLVPGVAGKVTLSGPNVVDRPIARPIVQRMQPAAPDSPTRGGEPVVISGESGTMGRSNPVPPSVQERQNQAVRTAIESAPAGRQEELRRKAEALREKARRDEATRARLEQLRQEAAEAAAEGQSPREIRQEIRQRVRERRP